MFSQSLINNLLSEENKGRIPAVFQTEIFIFTKAGAQQHDQNSSFGRFQITNVFLLWSARSVSCGYMMIYVWSHIKQNCVCMCMLPLISPLCTHTHRFWFPLRLGARPPRWAHQLHGSGLAQRRRPQPTPHQPGRRRRRRRRGRGRWPGRRCQTQAALRAPALRGPSATHLRGRQPRERSLHGTPGRVECRHLWATITGPPAAALFAPADRHDATGWNGGWSEQGHDGSPEGQWPAAAGSSGPGHDGWAGDERLAQDGLPEPGHGEQQQPAGRYSAATAAATDGPCWHEATATRSNEQGELCSLL